MHPHLFQFGHLIIPTYGVVAAVGLVAALALATRCARFTHLDEDAIWNLCIVAIAGTLIASRILLIAQSPRAFFTWPLLVLTLPSVTHWGIAFAAASAALYIVLRRMPLLTTFDTVAPAGMLLLTFLHLGDVFSGDDIGAATTSSLGQVLPAPGSHTGLGLYPVAPAAALASLTIATAALFWLPRRTQPGEVAGLALMLAAASRYLLDGYRPLWSLPDTATIASLRLDQILLLVLAALGGLLLLRRKDRSHAL